MKAADFVKKLQDLIDQSGGDPEISLLYPVSEFQFCMDPFPSAELYQNPPTESGFNTDEKIICIGPHECDESHDEEKKPHLSLVKPEANDPGN